MSEQNLSENRHFGRYLRRIREDRKLSLDAVEEMTVDYPEPVTKSHLSRIENGRAVPTFPRMFALCQVYGVPISSMAERFETDLRGAGGPAESFDVDNPDAFVERLQHYRHAGRYDVILKLTSAVLEGLQESSDGQLTELRWKLAVWQVSAMIKLEHYESCKLRCEELISEIPKTSEYYLRALISFVICAFRLKRGAVALMGLEQVEHTLQDGDWPPDLAALAHGTRGSVYYSLGDMEQTRTAYERALTCYEETGDDFESCRVRVNLAQVLIRRRQFQAAGRCLNECVKAATQRQFDGLLAYAHSHLALLHYLREQFDAAERSALKSNTFARRLGQRSTIFRNCYYLWKLAKLRGDSTAAASHEHNLKSLVHRVPQEMSEVASYRHERGDR